MMSMSSKVKPAFASAFSDAFTGPIPIMRGSTPTTAELTILAVGFKLYFFTASSEAKSMAAAPSFNPEAFPAVTVPSFLKAVRSFPNTSRELFAFINSSFEKMIGSFFLCGISTDTVSKSKRPSACAFAAFC